MIGLVERNRYGAIVIYGRIGIRQYYYYSESQARRLYIEECKRVFGE